MNQKKTAVITAAGSTIRKFALNLSFISHPCVLTAAIVVSDIMERLSPNIAPQTTAAIQTARGNPASSLIPTAIGASAAIVPMEVPMETEIKQLMMKRPATIKCAGISDRPRFTVLSTPPAAPHGSGERARAEKDQAHGDDIFLSTPFAMILTFSSKLTFLFCKNATNSAIRNATIAGIA